MYDHDYFFLTGNLQYYKLEEGEEMVLWFIVGSVVWILCVSFMLAIIKGGHRARGNRYEQKLCFNSVVNTQNIRNSRKKEVQETTRQNQRLLVS